jgi:flagellar L-ring protein precursor FlgH
MKKQNFLALGIGLASVPALAQTEAEADRAGDLFGKFRSPYVDRIAHRQGDILTILISETTSGTIGGTTTLSKTDTNSFTNGLPLLQGLFQSASTGATSSNAGAGTTTANGTLTAQMTVSIKKVLANGNFVIEGIRAIKVNKELQTYKLEGIVRPDDITPANTVASSKIQDASITVEGKGAIADRQRRGILTRILDWLF